MRIGMNSSSALSEKRDLNQPEYQADELLDSDSGNEIIEKSIRVSNDLVIKIIRT